MVDVVIEVVHLGYARAGDFALAKVPIHVPKYSISELSPLMKYDLRWVVENEDGMMTGERDLIALGLR